MEDKDLVSIIDNLLFEYWEDARSIISDFNELGGGPKDDEEEAYGYLEKISELIKKGGLSTAAKLEFLEEAFEEYNLQNSGFEDSLMDIFFEIERLVQTALSRNTERRMCWTGYLNIIGQKGLRACKRRSVKVI